MNTQDTEQQILDHVLETIATWEAELSALSPKLPEEQRRELVHMAAGMQQIRYATLHIRARIKHQVSVTPSAD